MSENLLGKKMSTSCLYLTLTKLGLKNIELLFSALISGISVLLFSLKILMHGRVSSLGITTLGNFDEKPIL
jgi:hypothetical protein